MQVASESGATVAGHPSAAMQGLLSGNIGLACCDARAAGGIRMKLLQANPCTKSPHVVVGGGGAQQVRRLGLQSWRLLPAQEGYHGGQAAHALQVWARKLGRIGSGWGWCHSKPQCSRQPPLRCSTALAPQMLGTGRGRLSATAAHTHRHSLLALSMGSTR